MLSVMVHGSENHTLDRDRRTGSKRKDPDVDETNREDVRVAGIRLCRLCFPRIFLQYR